MCNSTTDCRSGGHVTLLASSRAVFAIVLGDRVTVNFVTGCANWHRSGRALATDDSEFCYSEKVTGSISNEYSGYIGKKA